MVPTLPSFCSRRTTRSKASSAAPSSFNPGRIDHLFWDPHEAGARRHLFTRDELRLREQQQIDMLADRMQRVVTLLALQSALHYHYGLR